MNKRKKKYAKPVIEIIRVYLEGNLATSSNATVSFGDDDNFYSPLYESWDEQAESKNTFEF